MRQDILYALRAMRKNPAFTLTAVLTLALGIGANTAIFTVIRAVLLNPLPYRDPDRLVYLSMSDPQRNMREAQFTSLRFEQISGARSFAGVGAFGANTENVTLSGDFEPEPLKGARVSANFLDVLGTPPLLGRTFRPDEDNSGAPPVVMISAGLWKRRFGGDPRIAGQTAMLESTAYTIVGVLPPGFEFPFSGVDVWFTRPAEWSALPSRLWGIALLKGFARLKPEAGLPQARAEMEVLSREYNETHPGFDRGAMQVAWLKERLVENVRPMLGILLGAVAFVLLIACANVAGLLMARATSRAREFALRAALGAGRARLVRQLLAESLVLAFGGGAAGALLAQWCLTAIRGVDGLNLTGGPNALYLPGSGEIRLDGMVLAFTLALSVATGILFGLVLSLQLSRPDLAGVLRESGAGAGHGLSGRRGALGISPRAVLVAGQVALSIVLLIGAALLMRSLVRLRAVDPGFQASGLLTMKIALPSRYDTPEKRTSFYNSLLERVTGIPGVLGAATAMSLPATNWIRTTISRVEGQAAPDERDAASYAVVQSVAPGYFQTLQIPLRRGRAFTSRDNAPGAPAVIVVNDSLARRLWRDYPRGIDPVGRHIGESYDKAAGWLEVVGIAADIHEGGLAGDATPELYVPYALHPPQAAYLAVRTAADPFAFVNSIRVQVSALDRDQSISEVKTMEAVLERSLGNRPWTMWLLGAFAGMALLLALVGIYGVIAYSVSQRTQELGIRRALGAQQGDILKLVLREGFTLTAAGTLIGLAGAFALTRLMKGLLFQISPTDPVTMGGIALLFILVSGAASYLPARRAARVDPTAALRSS